MAPIGDLLIRLVHNACGPPCDAHPLHQIALLFIYLNASVNILRRTKWCKSLRTHIAKHAIRADEIRTPRRGRVAKFFGWLASVFGHNKLLRHPDRTLSSVSLARLSYIQVLAR